MAIWGDLIRGNPIKGVARAEAPTRVYAGVPGHTAGFEDVWAQFPVMLSNGEIYYLLVEDDRTTIRHYRPDAWAGTAEGGFLQPRDALLNDEVIATPACSPWGPFVARAGSEQLLYRCADEVNPHDWYDLDGRLVVSGPSVLAWHRNGQLLTSIPGENTLQLVLADGTTTRLGNDPRLGTQPWWVEIFHARTYGDGFWVLTESIRTGAFERWYLGTDLLWRYDGSFPSIVTGFGSEYFWPTRLDAEGRANGWVPKRGVVHGDLRFPVVRCEAVGGGTRELRQAGLATSSPVPVGGASSCEVLYDDSLDLFEGVPDDGRPRWQIHPLPYLGLIVHEPLDPDPLLTGP
jgi:hypothetical protein